MGRQFSGPSRGGIARAGALVLGCLALAHCSGSDRIAQSDSRYSRKVVEDGEPVPKGGGRYQVGKPYNINGRTYFPHENASYRAEGVASWYGPDFHGRLTANGEVYDMHGISAAHPTLPMPSYARVTNLDNGRSIVVRINDRGPYARNRVIDLSIGTAKALRFYGHGIARVRVEYLGRAPLEGSDDRMLLATLREGSPAPAPSRVMVAAAKPFLSGESAGRERALPPPSDRSASAGTASTRSAHAAASDITASSRPAARGGARTREAAEPPASGASVPAAGFAPREGGAGFINGRGLY